MLVLTVKNGERMKVGPDIWVTFVRMERGQVGLGFEAPREVAILREKLVGRPGVDGGAGGRS